MVQKIRKAQRVSQYDSKWKDSFSRCLTSSSSFSLKPLQLYHQRLFACLSVGVMLRLRCFHFVKHKRYRRFIHRRKRRCEAYHAHHSAATNLPQLGKF